MSLPSAKPEVFRSVSGMRRSSILKDLLLLPFLTLAVVLQYRLAWNMDVAWLVHAAASLMDGGRLFHDIIESNPPLILFLSMPAVALSRLSGLSLELASHCMTAAYLFLGFALLRRLLDAVSDLDRASRGCLFVLPAVAILFAPWSEFGQREHLMAALAAPLLFKLCFEIGRPQVMNRPLANAITVAGTIGFMIKPPYILLIGIMLLCQAASRRDWRPLISRDAVITVSLGGLYLASIWAFMPEYFSDVLPLAVETNAYLFRPLFDVLLAAAVPTAALALAFGLSLVGPLAPLQRHFVIGCAISGICLLALGVMQMKAFSNHLVPFLIPYSGLIALLLQRALGIWRSEGLVLAPRRNLIFVFAAAVLASPAIYWLHAPQKGEYMSFHKIARIVPFIEGRSYLALSDRMEFSMPISYYANATWASRINSLWSLRGAALAAHEQGTGVELGRAARVTIEFLVEDFRRYEPEVVVVDRVNYDGSRQAPKLEYLDLLLKDKAFAEEWKHYCRAEQGQSLEIYVRGDC